MKIGYYPGCTLKSKARDLDESAVKSLEALGVEMTELSRWNCCGAVYNLADDDLVHFLAPVRDLCRAKEEGYDKLITLCSMCFNTLARANELMKNDDVKREALNNFMEEEGDYNGEVEVVHLLTFLRDDFGWDKLKAAVKQPLSSLKVAPYYGCTLTRPRDVGIDDAMSPQIFEDFLAALGAEAVTYNEAQTCCGSYNIISAEDAALAKVAEIITSAGDARANSMALSCPLCEYNVSRRQDDALARSETGAEALPVYYFTQLLALALGLGPEGARLDLSPERSRKFLQEQGLLVSA